MAEKKIIPTIYQGLNKLLNLDGFGFDNTTPIPPQQTQSKIIIKGQTPEEIHAKGLELEQKREIQKKFFKTSDRSFQKALQYEAGRLQAYMDYESMEYYPLIASALDLFMEEATTIGANGKMLNIYSNKERIKYLLEEFFYDIVNVNVNLPFWTRNTTKYGDNFVLLYGERKKGIIHTKQMVNYEVDRIEKFVDGKPIIKFKEKMTGDEFNPFEIAHFRLLGDDKFIPFGSSILNRVRRVFRQLCLDKNTNILTPNGNIKIKDLKIGDEVYSYDYNSNKNIISKIKNVIKTGNKERFKVKTEYNEIILTEDHPILTVDSDNNYSYKNIKEINGEKLIHKFIFDPNNKHNHYQKLDILSIENVGVDEVWDIEVDNELHNFIANGLVVHNCMAEDAMLTYRLVRAGEKKVFKIDVGNIDEDDLEEYMYRVATKFKKTSQVNPSDGQFDYRYNIVGNDEDYFIPVRNANTQTGIETLPGACLSLDSKIELLDGRSLTLFEIINEYEQGKELWSYSINPETGEIVPGLISWAGKTRLNTDVLKITLDNGETITCTHDHKFNTKFNGTKEAKDLLVGESMWSFNKKFETIRNSKSKYEMIYDHNKKKFLYTHRVVGNYFKNINEHTEFVFNKKYINEKKETIHHINRNRLMNVPYNLTFMNNKDHYEYHSANINEYNIIGGESYKNKYNTDINFKEIVDERLKNCRENYHNKLKTDNEFKERVTKKQSESAKKYINNLSDDERKERAIRSTNNIAKGNKIFHEKYKNDESFKREVIEKARISSIITKNKPENKIRYSINSKKLWENEEFRNNIIEKQKIKFSEKLLDLLVDYFDKYKRLDFILEKEINIEGSEWLNEFWRLNEGNQQLKKLSQITYNNIDKLLKHFGYLNWNDFKKKVPCYNHKIVSIEYLSEKQDTGTITIDGNEIYHNFHNFALSCGIFTKNSNLNDVNDIEYLRNNLLSGLAIPKPFVSFEDAAGGGKNLAQFDIRFSKKVNRIQQAMIQELNKMAMIHLYLLGYSGDDLSNFTLTLTNSSTQQELLKSELMREKATTYKELTGSEGGIAAMSHTSAKRMIFNMSDREIVEDLKQQKMERAIAQELQDAPIIIKKTGLFNDIDAKYGEPIEGLPVSGSSEQQNQLPPNNSGSGGAPMDNSLPMGGETGGVPPTNSEIPNETGGNMGGGAPAGGNIGAGEMPLAENNNNNNNNNNSGNKFISNKLDSLINELVYGSTNDSDVKKELDYKKIITENNDINFNLNSSAQRMISEIDELLKSDVIDDNMDDVDNNNNNIEIEDIDINDIDDNL